MFEEYMMLTGATFDDDTEYLMISSDDYENLESLFFNIGGTQFEFTPNAQTWPRSLNTAIRGETDSIYLTLHKVCHFLH